jgi:hypothetical protein
MNRWLAHYDISSVVKITGPLRYRHPAGLYEIALENGDPETLVCKMVFEADGIEVASEFAEAEFHKFLHKLAVATSTPYRVKTRHCIIDWTPGVTERDVLIYRNVADDEPIGELLAADLDKALNFVDACNLLPSAMRWYCARIRATIPEDQFLYFFYAIELVAEHAKSSERVRNRCQKCGGFLKCEDCGDLNEHRPFKTQAIKTLLRKVRVGDTRLEDLFAIRHGLSHGQSREALEQEIQKRTSDFTFDKAVDVIGWAAWNALFFVSKVSNGTKIPPFTHVSSFATHVYKTAIHLSIQVAGDPDNPQYNDVVLPNVSITMN